MQVQGSTAVYGIFGDPIQHTRSPAMQNAAFEACSIDAIYLPFHVQPHHLETAVQSIRALGISGLNITVPHKTAIIPFLDELTETAIRIGAVNTVLNRQGTLVGTNTDGSGFVQSLDAVAFKPKAQNIGILGAGGAARAILVALAEADAKQLFIQNRSPEKAALLVQEFSKLFPKTKFHAVSMDALQAEDLGLLINTTTVGMHGDESPVDLSKFKSVQHVADIIYQNTPLLQQAVSLNIPHLNGSGMLLYQGCQAFEFWTQKPAPVDIMRHVLLG